MLHVLTEARDAGMRALMIFCLLTLALLWTSHRLPKFRRVFNITIPPITRMLSWLDAIT
jgi:hypothetical protein